MIVEEWYYLDQFCDFMVQRKMSFKRIRKIKYTSFQINWNFRKCSQIINFYGANFHGMLVKRCSARLWTYPGRDDTKIARFHDRQSVARC